MVSEEIKIKWNNKVKAIFDAHETGFIKMNDWEIEFMDSIEKQLSDDKEISFKQSSILYKIYDKII